MTATGRAAGRALFGDGVRAGVAALRRSVRRAGVPRAFQARARASSWKPSCGRISSRSRATPGVPLYLVNARMSAALRARLRARPRAHATDACRAVGRRGADARPTRRGSPRWARRPPVVTGNLKFDAGAPDDGEALGREFRVRFGAARPVWVAASTRDGEEAMILDALAAHDAAARHADRHRPAPSAAIRRGGRAPAPARRSRSSAAAATRRCRRTSTSCSATRWARCPAISRPRTSRSSAAACCRWAGRT